MHVEECQMCTKGASIIVISIVHVLVCVRSNARCTVHVRTVHASVQLRATVVYVTIQRDQDNTLHQTCTHPD